MVRLLRVIVIIVVFVLSVYNYIAINNTKLHIYQEEGRRFVSLLSGSRTFSKGIIIQVLERNGWKRTLIGARLILNGRKEMAIVSNEPGHVTTATERV